MNRQDARRLLQKYRLGQCTPEEKSWVEQWYLEIARQEVAMEDDIVKQRLSTWKVVQSNISNGRRHDYLFRRPLQVAASIVILLGLSFLTYQNRAVFFKPKSEQLVYTVTEFKINNRTSLDIVRWRRFFYHDADTSKNILFLQDKNRAKNEEESGSRPKKSNSKTETKTDSIAPLTWRYQRPSKDRIIISGIDDRKDSIYVVLDRVSKDYALKKRRKDYYSETIQSKF